MHLVVFSDAYGSYVLQGARRSLLATSRSVRAGAGTVSTYYIWVDLEILLTDGFAGALEGSPISTHSVHDLLSTVL